MKHLQDTTSSPLKTTATDVVRWAMELRHLHTRIAPFFARPEPRRRCLWYLQGMLSDVARKNGWQLAEHAGEKRPDGMQRFLSNAVWQHDQVRDELRRYVLERLGAPHAIVAIDETSFPKRGKKSAGVAQQYCGSTKQVENCQVGVFLSYISSLGHTLLDRELYLPQHWIENRTRCKEAGIPETVKFQTKCELARRMMERLHQAQVSVEWVVADTVYGNNLDLRTWLEEQGYWYVLAVANTEPIEILTADGKRLLTVKQAEQLLVKPQEWQRVSVRTGTKGPLFFDWACLPVLHRCQDDKRRWLLLRRIPDNPAEITYYLVFGPIGTTLEGMARAIGARWCIEEEFENSKDLGLDRYEVRSFPGWLRHITLVLLALAALTVICADERRSGVANEPNPAPPFPIALTVPEVRRLLGRLLYPLSRNASTVLAWSWWRRCQQARASISHAKRRLNSS